MYVGVYVRMGATSRVMWFEGERARREKEEAFGYQGLVREKEGA